MSKTLSYSSTLTGASFLFFELRVAAELKEQGLEDSEVRDRVSTKNLFQYRVKSSIKSRFPSVMRRVNSLDDTLRKMVLQQPAEVGKVINLYAIMKTDRLFYEFMNEVIRDKFEQNQYVLEAKDVHGFINAKAEQEETVARWTEKTVEKLKQTYLRVMVETGILRDRKTGELNRILMEEKLKQHLVRIGDAAYVKAMGEWVK